MGNWDTWSAGFASWRIHANSKADFNGCIEQMLQVAKAVKGLKVLHHIGKDIEDLPKSDDGWHFSKAAAPGLRALLLASLASSGAGTAPVAAVESAPALRVLLPSCHGFLLSS